MMWTIALCAKSFQDNCKWEIVLDTKPINHITGRFNSLLPYCNLGTNFQTHIKDSYLECFLWNCPQMPQDLSTLVQVMAWCRQAASHYWSQCWPMGCCFFGAKQESEPMMALCWSDPWGSDSRQWGPCNLHKSCNHNLYIGIIIGPMGNAFQLKYHTFHSR